mgnify:CR=1 FL=1
MHKLAYTDRPPLLLQHVRKEAGCNGWENTKNTKKQKNMKIIQCVLGVLIATAVSAKLAAPKVSF